MANNPHVYAGGKSHDIGQRILKEIIKQGMVNIAHPDPQEKYPALS